MATTTTTMASLLLLEPARFLIAPSFTAPAEAAAYHCDSKLAAVSFPSLKCRHLPSAAAIASPAPTTPASSSSRLLPRKSVAVAVQVRRIILCSINCSFFFFFFKAYSSEVRCSCSTGLLYYPVLLSSIFCGKKFQVQVRNLSSVVALLS